MENPAEDMATFGEDFYVSGTQLREYARSQMQAGNFEPAVKYLFIRYFIFEGNEYGLNDRSTSLGYSEIRDAIRGASGVRVSTRRALDQIRSLNGLR